MPFSEFLAQKHLPEHLAARVKGYVEGFNAADATRIGTAALRKQQQAEEEIDGDWSFRIAEGYDRLAGYLLDSFIASGGTLHLNTPATSVIWSSGEVRVATANTQLPEIPATRAVIAVPSGRSPIRISPHRP